MDQSTTSINSLPNEIILLILKNNNCTDIVNFGTTCKRFNEMVKCTQSLWKMISKQTLPEEIYEVINNHCDGDWLNEIKTFYTVKQQVNTELIAMSPHFFWKITYDYTQGEQKIDVMLEDIRHFFAIALTNRYTYFYVVHILQEIILTGNRMINEYKCKKPYTLTEMHYAKVILRHLIHTFLAIKWITKHVKNELTPEIVINFFLQWIDTGHLFSDEEITEKINELIEFAILVMADKFKSKPENVMEMCANGTISGLQIHAAVTHVVYRDKHMSVTSAANLETLNLLKVITHKCGNVVAVGTVYQAVAKHFGINCELIVFPNHLFLEWRDATNNKVYTVDLVTGELRPKRQCPYSYRLQNDPGYKYCPDSMVQYVYTAYSLTMGSLRNWNTQNATDLLDFLNTNQVEANNPYRNFLPYLIDHSLMPQALSNRLDFKCLSKEHMQLIHSLAHLNSPPKAAPRPFAVKQHESRVKFAVGMICYHKKYNYVCIIRDWDLSCSSEWQRLVTIDALEFGHDQPFYNIIVADQSERYVAQENLIEVSRPTRLYHLEDIIAREFTHYNGFAYVPNDQKSLMYPEDLPISNMYRTRAQYKTRDVQHE